MTSNDESSAILESGFSLLETKHEADDIPINSAALAITDTNTTMASVVFDPIESLRQRILDDVVGQERSSEGATEVLIARAGTIATFTSPLEFQPGKPATLPLVYCDFTASHRPLKSIESYLTEKCLPLYGNTHTNTSLTGSQSTAFCSEARQIVGDACGAKTTGKASQDVVMFAGNGTTSAVELLIDCLGLKHHILAMDSTDESSINDKPLILVGPYEHHSNLLPWRELGNVDIKTVNLDPRAGNMDLDHLKFLLEQHASRKVKIGAFSAASNVTGVIADDCAITALLHQYGALSIWDYATGASYLDVQMNPRHPDYSHAPELLAKDAVVLSGHKLLGGVGTPGVLIIKKHLVSQQNPPSRSGGGTVFYVTANHHRYLSNRIERFEGGTPNIVGIWRLGLVVTTKSQLKKAFEQLSSSDSSSEKGEHTKLTVLDYDLQRARRIQKELSKIKNLVLMDALHSEDEKYVKLPVFSFLIKCGVRFLHYNYVCAILNDLFGIQSRGGCQCAGPFAQYLLGLHGQVNKAVEECLDDSKAEILRPGFSRLSLPTLGTTKAIEDYVIKAIDWVARNGWKLMHLYQYNQRTGVWRHKSRRGTPLGKTEPNQLSHYRTPIIKSTLHERNNDRPFQSAPTLDEALHAADELLQAVLKRCSTFIQATKTSDKTDEDSSSLSDLRWYVYPKDVAVFLNQGCDEVPGTANRYLLLGAVRPVAWFPIHNVQIPAESGETKALKLSTRMHLEVAMAKKNPNDLDCRESSLGPMHYPEREIAALGAQNCTCDPTTGVFYPNDWVSFEDGEYFGQAPISKIEAGYHNGDLSSACMLYHTEGDEWERIDLFLARQHRLTTNSLATKTTVTDCSFDTKVLDDKTSLSTNRSHQLAPASGDVATLDLNMVGKDKNKKVQRDASTLGKRAWFRPLRLRFEKGKKGNPQTTPTPTNALG